MHVQNHPPVTCLWGYHAPCTSHVCTATPCMRDIRPMRCCFRSNYGTTAWLGPHPHAMAQQQLTPRSTTAASKTKNKPPSPPSGNGSSHQHSHQPLRLMHPSDLRVGLGCGRTLTAGHGRAAASVAMDAAPALPSRNADLRAVARGVR